MKTGTLQVRAYTRLTRVSRGHTDEIVRLIAFLAIGAVVASINLLMVWVLSHQHLLPYVIYITLATEVSILCSFMLNDRITFQRLIASGHIWHVRCLRFHSAAAVGALFTIGLSTVMYHLAHFPPVAAQFTAIVVATGLNYSMHRFWTYRPNRRHIIVPPGTGTKEIGAEYIEVAMPVD